MEASGIELRLKRRLQRSLPESDGYQPATLQPPAHTHKRLARARQVEQPSQHAAGRGAGSSDSDSDGGGSGAGGKLAALSRSKFKVSGGGGSGSSGGNAGAGARVLSRGDLLAVPAGSLSKWQRKRARQKAAKAAATASREE